MPVVFRVNADFTFDNVVLKSFNRKIKFSEDSRRQVCNGNLEKILLTVVIMIFKIGKYDNVLCIQ